MKKPTKATKKPAEKTMPQFESHLHIVSAGMAIVADAKGDLYRIDVMSGTVSKVKRVD